MMRVLDAVEGATNITYPQPLLPTTFVATAV